jgi:hypothetical protein
MREKWKKWTLRVMMKKEKAVAWHSSADAVQGCESSAESPYYGVSSTDDGGRGMLWGRALEQIAAADRQELKQHGLSQVELLNDILESTTAAQDASRKRRWMIRWKGAEIDVRGVAQNIVQWVNQFKAVGDVLMQYDPSCLSLPWAGVRALLQVITLEHELAGILLLGVEKVSFLITKCIGYESPTVTGTMLGESLVNYQNALLSLYTGILKFLVSTRKFFDRRFPGKRFAPL